MVSINNAYNVTNIMKKSPLYSNNKFNLHLFIIKLKTELIITVIINFKDPNEVPYESVFRVKNNKFKINISNENEELISFCIESDLFFVNDQFDYFEFELTPNLILSAI